jgi:hypothetical protein
MDYTPGTRYERPPEATPSWAHDQLAQVRQIAVGDPRIEVELVGGTTAVGRLESIGSSPLGGHGEAVVDGDTIECEQVHAFKLLPDPPLDRSDEMRS